MGTKLRSVLLVSAIFAGLVSTGCGGDGSKQSAAPKPGSIGHAWATAGDTYKKGEYVRTLEYLSRVASNQNEYREKARLMLLVVAGGVSDGYIELANAYETGSKINKTMGLEFRKSMGEARNVANSTTMQFVETANDFLSKNKDTKVAFDFIPFPTGSVAEPVQLTKVLKGYNIQQADNEVLARAMAQRGVVKLASSMVGAPGDASKAAAQFAAPSADVFWMALAESLYKKADLYCNRKMDMPRRGNALCKVALDALAMVPDSKDKKALEAKVKEEMKRHKIES